MTPTPPSLPGQRRACVIGAGLGGLALAIRLQSAGVSTVLVEAREVAGGRAGSIERGGFHFDTGPAMLADRAALAELWQLAGQDMASDLALLQVSPAWRFNWPDGTLFDYAPDSPELLHAVARLSPGDVLGFEEFQRHCAGLWQDLRGPAASDRFSLGAVARLAAPVARHQAWRTYYGLVRHFVKSEKLREALSFPALLQGASPCTAPASLAAAHHGLREGMWYPHGGMGQIAAALVKLFERIGGTLRLHDPVLHVHTLGNQASEVETASGWRERFDAVASNADVVHTYRDLLVGNPRGREVSRKLTQKRFAPAMFTVYFGVEGSWPGIPHSTVLFGPRFKGLFDDVFTYGVLPQDQLIVLNHPSVTDPSVAPTGKSTFSASVPVAHQGKLPVDWETLGALVESRVLAEVGRRLIPDLPDRIVTKFHTSPRDAGLEFNAWLGSAWSLEALFSQSGCLRARNRDAKLTNLYLAGAATAQGAGTSGVIASARATAKLMLENLR